MSALLLDLMGVPVEVIGKEYALTRIGSEPFRQKLLPAALKKFARTGVDSIDEGGPGLREFFSTDAGAMVDFIIHVQHEYGGAEGYLKTYLGFSAEDLEEIKNKLKPGNNEV